MNFPQRYRKFDLASWPFGFQLAGQGPILPALASYPPFGYLPAELFDLGNGDSVGFYWPIGRESAEPLLCELHHDGWYLDPYASSLETLVTLKVAEGFAKPGHPSWGDVELLCDTLGISRPVVPTHSLDLAQMPLELDPQSPALLFAHAKAANQRGELEWTEALARQAIASFPEFTEARFLLATALRRTRRIEEAAHEMLAILSSPLAFGRGHAKCLEWLRRLSDADCPSCTSDPIWQRRSLITLATGVKHNSDLEHFEACIADLLRRGEGERAIRLRVLVGELMAAETHSFRERYGYGPKEHLRRLGNDLDQAQLLARKQALLAAQPWPDA